MKRVLNGRIVPVAAGERTEPSGATGVFETLRLQGGRARFFGDHWRRFYAGCAHYGIAAPAAGAIRIAARELMAANALSDGVLRWSAWREVDGGVGWQMGIEPPRPHMTRQAWRAASCVVPLPLADAARTYKHLSRQHWHDALREARAAGFDEAILWDEQGRLVEGAVSNFFCFSGGVLCTPALEWGPLPGIARGRVLGIARDLGIRAGEVVLTRAELQESTECFFTNSLIGLRPISEIDGRILLAPGPVTARLQQAWVERLGPF